MEYGLIGENVTYSFSPRIHQQFNDKEYSLLSLNAETFNDFVMSKNFKGINVTMPYKEKIIPYLDEMDDISKKIGVVNTVINKDGKLYGYNTDADGFLYLLKKNKIQVKNKKVLILGNGATAKTIKYVLIKLNVKNVYIVSRNKSKQSITYQEAKNLFETQIIINTTPLGTFPNIDEMPDIDMNNYPYLETCIDVIYNPFKTKFLRTAKKRGLKIVSGLEMLVYQAALSRKLFDDIDYDEATIRKVYLDTLLKMRNIVFVGLPACGKSTASKNVAKALNMVRIDLDEEIEKQENLTINEIFKVYGETKFREIERQLFLEFISKNGQVISLGGGTLHYCDNIEELLCNSIVFFLNRNLNLLKRNKKAAVTRPLLKQETIEDLYKERITLYKLYNDYEIINNGTPLNTFNKIMEKLI